MFVVPTLKILHRQRHALRISHLLEAFDFAKKMYMLPSVALLKAQVQANEESRKPPQP